MFGVAAVIACVLIAVIAMLPIPYKIIVGIASTATVFVGGFATRLKFQRQQTELADHRELIVTVKSVNIVEVAVRDGAGEIKSYRIDHYTIRTLEFGTIQVDRSIYRKAMLTINLQDTNRMVVIASTIYGPKFHKFIRYLTDDQ